MPILKQKYAKSTDKVAVHEGFKSKVQVNRKLIRERQTSPDLLVERP